MANIVVIPKEIEIEVRFEKRIEMTIIITYFILIAVQ